MSVSVLTFVNWRSTLVALQTALAGTLTSVVSAEGYALLSALTAAGATYDLAGDDSPRNTSTFSSGAGVVPPPPLYTVAAQPYMIQAQPVFAEKDRVSRLIYSTYASTATLAQGQAFGLYPGATVLPPGLTAPAPLALLWDTASALWASLAARANVAGAMVVAANNEPLFVLLAAAEDAADPYLIPPVNPSPIAAAASSVATSAVNGSVANASAWLQSLSFQ